MSILQNLGAYISSPFESVEDLSSAGRYLGYVLIRELSGRGAGSASLDA